MKRLVNNPDWEEAKRKVRIRDGHKCQMCGKDFNLEIHLCGDCHSKVHKYHIKL